MNSVFNLFGGVLNVMLISSPRNLSRKGAGRACDAGGVIRGDLKEIFIDFFF